MLTWACGVGQHPCDEAQHALSSQSRKIRGHPATGKRSRAQGCTHQQDRYLSCRRSRRCFAFPALVASNLPVTSQPLRHGVPGDCAAAAPFGRQHPEVCATLASRLKVLTVNAPRQILINLSICQGWTLLSPSAMKSS